MTLQRAVLTRKITPYLQTNRNNVELAVVDDLMFERNRRSLLVDTLVINLSTQHLAGTSSLKANMTLQATSATGMMTS